MRAHAWVIARVKQGRSFPLLSLSSSPSSLPALQASPSLAAGPLGFVSYRLLLILMVLGLVGVQAFSLGITDDEAYYWVLAQHLQGSYAYHPPAVAWLIALVQAVIPAWLERFDGWIRLGAIACVGGIVWLAQTWVRRQLRDGCELGGRGGVDGRDRWAESEILLSLLAFPGFFALCWMIVPDLPLLLGVTLLWTKTWEFCDGVSPLTQKSKALTELGLVAGSALVITSKYSGVLAWVSSLMALQWMAPPATTVRWWQGRKTRGWVLLLLGAGLAAAPIFIWNAQHEWGSILFQLRDRHRGGHFSLARFLRFWVLEMVLIGPPLFYFYGCKLAGAWRGSRPPPVAAAMAGPTGPGWRLVQGLWQRLGGGRVVERQGAEGAGRGEVLSELPPSAKSRPPLSLAAYVLFWVLPAGAVFGLQPLYSDFKLHWFFVVGWPLVMAAATTRDRFWRQQESVLCDWSQVQRWYSALLTGLVVLALQTPWLNQGLARLAQVRGVEFDPRLDVSNDLWGWQDLEHGMEARFGPAIFQLPVLAGRYQTAAQAAFALRHRSSVSLLARNPMVQQEWPDFTAVAQQDAQGRWHLQQPCLWVADGRYSEPPPFQTPCTALEPFWSMRGGVAVKKIQLWRCEVSQEPRQQ